MTEAEFAAFLATVFQNLAGHSVDGAIHFVCMDWRHIGEVVAAGKDAYTELKNLCVWAKTNGGMGSLYRSQHELVFVFKAGTGSHINNVELGKHGRYQTNLWSYAGTNSFGKDRDAELALHPTVKPVALVADAIRDCSKRGGIVLDAFAGSSTTRIAAEKTGRRGYRCYVSQALVRGNRRFVPRARRVPVGDVERLVEERFAAFLKNQGEIFDACEPLFDDVNERQEVVDRAADLAAR